jgi:hypothetical protein
MASTPAPKPFYHTLRHVHDLKNKFRLVLKCEEWVMLAWQDTDYFMAIEENVFGGHKRKRAVTPTEFKKAMMFFMQEALLCDGGVNNGAVMYLLDGWSSFMPQEFNEAIAILRYCLMHTKTPNEGYLLFKTGAIPAGEIKWLDEEIRKRAADKLSFLFEEHGVENLDEAEEEDENGEMQEMEEEEAEGDV